MNKKLGLFLIVSFLSMQILTFLHMASYAFETHEHNGHVCKIYQYCEHTKYSSLGADITLQAPEYFAFTTTLPEVLFVHSKNYGFASPRAPPRFS